MSQVAKAVTNETFDEAHEKLNLLKFVKLAVAADDDPADPHKVAKAFTLLQMYREHRDAFPNLPPTAPDDDLAADVRNIKDELLELEAYGLSAVTRRGLDEAIEAQTAIATAAESAVLPNYKKKGLWRYLHFVNSLIPDSTESLKAMLAKFPDLMTSLLTANLLDLGLAAAEIAGAQLVPSRFRIVTVNALNLTVLMRSVITYLMYSPGSVTYQSSFDKPLYRAQLLSYRAALSVADAGASVLDRVAQIVSNTAVGQAVGQIGATFVSAVPTITDESRVRLMNLVTTAADPPLPPVLAPSPAPLNEPLNETAILQVHAHDAVWNIKQVLIAARGESGSDSDIAFMRLGINKLLPLTGGLQDANASANAMSVLAHAGNETVFTSSDFMHAAMEAATQFFGLSKASFDGTADYPTVFSCLAHLIMQLLRVCSLIVVLQLLKLNNTSFLALLPRSDVKLCCEYIVSCISSLKKDSQFNAEENAELVALNDRASAFLAELESEDASGADTDILADMTEIRRSIDGINEKLNLSEGFMDRFRKDLIVNMTDEVMRLVREELQRERVSAAPPVPPVPPVPPAPPPPPPAPVPAITTPLPSATPTPPAAQPSSLADLLAQNALFQRRVQQQGQETVS